MPEGKFSNPETIQQTKIGADKMEESPTEEKTSEILDVVEKRSASQKRRLQKLPMEILWNIKS